MFLVFEAKYCGDVFRESLCDTRWIEITEFLKIGHKSGLRIGMESAINWIW